MEVVVAIEDAFEVYQRLYDPLRPLDCINETNKQFIKEERITCELEKLEKVNFVYLRNRVTDVFMISEQLAGRREMLVTETRNAVNFAQNTKYTSAVLYPRIEKIVLVTGTDNLNIHAEASRYKAFKLEDAHCLPERFECNYTPKQGNCWTWLKLRWGL